MSKISELLINVVSIETPKLLSGVAWLVAPLHVIKQTTGEVEGSNSVM